MPAATLARLVLLEARRSGLPWLAAAGLLLAIALSVFLSQMALTESRAVQLAIVAPLLRAITVFLVALHVAGSTLREMQDRTLEVGLALPLPRAAHYLGRLAGHAACAALLALALALPLLAWAAPGRVALWGASLAMEASLVAAVSLFFAMSLGQLLPSIGLCIGFYLTARMMAAIQAMAAAQPPEAPLAAEAARLAVEGIALLLPRLDAVTRTEWLLYDAPLAGGYASALAGLAIYALLATAAGLFDFYRKQL